MKTRVHEKNLCDVLLLLCYKRQFQKARNQMRHFFLSVSSLSQGQIVGRLCVLLFLLLNLTPVDSLHFKLHAMVKPSVVLYTSRSTII